MRLEQSGVQKIQKIKFQWSNILMWILSVSVHPLYMCEYLL